VISFIFFFVFFFSFSLDINLLQFVAINTLGCLCCGISTNARTAVILGIKAERVGVAFGHAEGLVTISCGVMTDVDLVVLHTARVVFDDTKVIFDVVGFGLSGDFLEFRGAALVGFLFADHFVSEFSDAIIGASIDARKLEGVLDGVAF